MKLSWIFTITMIAGMPGLSAEKPCVAVRLQGSIEVPHKTLLAAELLNIQLFKEIGVSMRWEAAGGKREVSKCIEIGLEFNSDSPQALLPGALAYATPYSGNGTRIRIFIDRVLRGQRTGAIAEAQLGCVMAHEIGHVLEGVSRHSAEGVMMAHTPNASVLNNKLHFAHEDVLLIYAGMLRPVSGERVSAK